MNEFACGHAQRCTAPDPEHCGRTVLIDGDAKLYRSICLVLTSSVVFSKCLRRSQKLPCGLRPQQRCRTCRRHSHRKVLPPRSRKARGPKLTDKRVCSSTGEPDCRTEKSYVGVRWHKTRGVLNAVLPCGVVASLDEMYTHKSKTQACDLIQRLCSVSDSATSSLTRGTSEAIDVRFAS